MDYEYRCKSDSNNNNHNNNKMILTHKKRIRFLPFNFSRRERGSELGFRHGIGTI